MERANGALYFFVGWALRALSAFRLTSLSGAMPTLSEPNS
jgi:hypothetical protein